MGGAAPAYRQVVSVAVAPRGPALVGSRGRALALAGAAVVPGGVALWLAADAGIEGPAAVPATVRAGAALVLLYGLAGYAPARLLVPPALRAHLPLLVLPFGACSAGLALALLGFLRVPFDVSLPTVLAAGTASAIAVRIRLGPARAPAGADPLPLRLLLPVWIALLVAAIALIPLFRGGFATVIGQNGDAELAVGVAEFLQEEPPTAVAPEQPLDRMPGVWRSKYPIYYPLAAVSRLSGLEPYEVFTTVMAAMLALAAAAFFFFARYFLRAGPWTSLLVMALVPLDRILVHLAIHPYHNQIWGVFLLPLILVLGLCYLREPGRRSAIALILFGALGAFAYPLMLPFPLVVLGLAAWVLRSQGGAGRWIAELRLPRPRRALAWVPLGLVALPFLAVVVKGVVEKSGSALNVLAPGTNLYGWRGADGFLPFPMFFGVSGESVLSFAAVAAMLVAAGWALRSRPREVALPLAVMGVGALAVAGYFRAREYGDLFFFKDLGFFGPYVVAGAVVAVAELRARGAAVACAAALAVTLAAGARDEISKHYEMLSRDLLELREWDNRLPRGESVRIDVPPSGYQLWARHMLHERPLSASRPLRGTIFPHPPHGRKADFVLSPAGRRPRDADGAPILRNRAYSLYRMKASVPGPDISSRRLVDTSSKALD
jgi:hypothetical protein